MSKINSQNQFEDVVRLSFGVPEMREEFVEDLNKKLICLAEVDHPKRRRSFIFQPGWIITLALIILLVVGTLVIGPQRVLAAVRLLLGYIPGIGIVDQSNPIRVLTEPVSVTRDGITVSVNQAVLTPVETRLNYGVSGVSLSAYPKEEDESGCIEHEYLRLPDDTRIDINDPVPANVNEAIFVLPCIFNTLPDTAPIDWELPLQFVAAPPDFTILPVIDLTPQITPTESERELIAITPTTHNNGSTQAMVSVDKIIETENGYILIGAIRPQTSVVLGMQVTGVPVLRDANGKKVSYTYPQDINEYDLLDLKQGDQPFSLQFNSSGVFFPLIIEIPGMVIFPAEPQATAKLAFNAGPNPRPGQVWTINQDIQIGEHVLSLISVTADSRNGYSFEFKAGREVYSVGVQIDGYTATGGGGGPNYQGFFHTSVSYAELPKGNLTFIISHLVIASDTQIWKTQWSPDLNPFNMLTAITNPSRACLDADSFQNIKNLPLGLDGWVLMTEINPELRIVFSSLDGTQTRELASNGSRGTLTLDGKRMAFPSSDGIAIVDTNTGELSVINNLIGYDLHWSPNGLQIALINANNSFGVFIVNTDGSDLRQISNLGYESIAGWSPDGKQLYFAMPDSSGEGWLLKAANIVTGDISDLFIMNDSSRKAPMPTLSLDGNWIAYRGSDNASLYLMSMKGTERRLILDRPAIAINGIVWEKEGHLLGISLITTEKPDGEVILLQIDNCEAYRLPGVLGEVDGIFLP